MYEFREVLYSKLEYWKIEFHLPFIYDITEDAR